MKCPVCKGDIVGRTPRAIYCSESCCNRGVQRRAKGKPIEDDLEEKACAICGRPFTPSRNGHRVCSDRCISLAYNRRLRGVTEVDVPDTVENCVICGEEFVKTQSKPRKKCCSAKCGKTKWYLDNKDRLRIYMREYMRRRKHEQG